MSTSYLSFASIARLHNNNPLKASPLGELSNKSRTYAKDAGKFNLGDTTVSPTELVNFLSLRDTTEIAMPQSIATVQIGISNWLYDQAKLGNITDSRTNTLQLLKAQFTNNISIDDVGEMVTNNAIYLPSFVTGYHTVGTDQQQFYLWFADDYFQIQYPRVSFTAVHPLPLASKGMDVLMNANYQEIAAILAKQTQVVVAQRERQLTSDYQWPYTERNPIEFEIVDLVNTGQSNMGTWVILSWGNGADAEDQLFDQLQKEILANTAFSRARWEEKIPDLFNPLEFYIIPEFGRLGVVNRTNGASTYSPIVDRETSLNIATKYLGPTMPADHLIKSGQTITFMYKSLQALFVAKVNNRAGLKKISAVVPYYQLISSLDADFDTMGQNAMDFVKGMEDLLAAAEVVTPISLLPTGVTRIERLGKLCVSKRINRVKYVAFTRWQMVEDGLVEA